jgi:hypothetical protein
VNQSRRFRPGNTHDIDRRTIVEWEDEEVPNKLRGNLFACNLVTVWQLAYDIDANSSTSHALSCGMV